MDYNEDSNAQVDANFVITGSGRLVEIQATAEKDPFSEDEFNKMLALSKTGVEELIRLQKQALKID